MSSESILLNIPSNEKNAPSAPIDGGVVSIPLIQNQQQEGQAYAQNANAENNYGSLHPPFYSAVPEIPVREGHSPPAYSVAAEGVWIIRIPKLSDACPSCSFSPFPIYSFLVICSVFALVMTIVSMCTTAIFSHRMPIISQTASLIVTVNGGYWDSCIVTPDSDYPPARASTQCTLYSENGISHEASWQRATQAFSLISVIAAGVVCLFIIFSPSQKFRVKERRGWLVCLGLSLLSGFSMLVALLVCRVVGPDEAAFNIVLDYGGKLAAVSIGLQAIITVSCIIITVTRSSLDEAWKSCRSPAMTA